MWNGRRMKLICQCQQAERRSVTDVKERLAVLNIKCQRGSTCYLCAARAVSAENPSPPRPDRGPGDGSTRQVEEFSENMESNWV